MEWIGRGAEAEVGDGHRPRLLGVEDEVALGEEVGLLADDLDRVAVGAHSAVRAEAVEEGAHGVLRLGVKAGDGLQAQVRHVVADADREVALRRLGGELRENAGDHGGVNSLEARP